QYVQSPGSKQRYSLRAIVSALPPRGSSARARAAGRQRAQRRLKEARGPQGKGTNHRNDITLRGPAPIHGAVAQVAVAVAVGPGVQPLPAPLAAPVVLYLEVRAEPDPALAVRAPAVRAPAVHARSNLRGRLQR